MTFSNSIKTLLGTSVLVFFASTALGQTSDNSGAASPGNMGGFGLHGGLTFNDFDYTSSGLEGAKTNKTGGMGGIHIEGFSHDIIALRLEANYESTGFHLANVGTVNYNYLQIPLLVKVTPFVGPIGVFVEGGAAASIHLSTSIDTTNSTYTYNTDTSTWDFGLLAGAGLNFKLTDHFLVEAEGRYEYGLTNISDASNANTKVRDVQLIVGFTMLN
jgi:opacity protein-like surface antigen